MRRLTRLTLAFSKKLDNFEAVVGLHFAFCISSSGTHAPHVPQWLRVFASKQWSIGEIVEATA